ncbi:uncharacterized protein LOC126736277 [Anthonomus grandis grandis]|uniref:uncharacterized protein LOC126736277 n=1 Tax=Anthonomus grandis grandis TaxID=2921223 RepID=UPI002165AB26|nr:uncharacterized protein LOC126736277 [Anthonomus grandis grandis]
MSMCIKISLKMSFSLSSRFPENVVVSPSPTAYTISKTLNDNAVRHGTSWTRHPLVGSQKCDDNCGCGPICSRYSGKCHQRCNNQSNQAGSRRLSLNPSFICPETSNKEKDSRRSLRPRLSLSYTENKENIQSPQRKFSSGQSSIPRFKKNATETQAFSFMNRQRSVHNCYAKQETNSEHSSRQKPSVKQDRNNLTNESIEQDSLENESLNPLNVSYTILPKIDEEGRSQNPSEQQKPKDLNITDDEKTTELKPLKDSIYSTPQSKLKDLSELLETKTKDLTNSARSKKYYDITCESEKRDKGVKSRDLFGINDYNLILIGEEYIDDDYDSYIENLNGAVGRSQVLQNQELYEMTKYLVRLYLNRKENLAATTARATSSPLQSQSFKPNSKKKLGKTSGKQRKNQKTLNIWQQVEAIVKNAIGELKVEFQNDIYACTNQKLDRLISEIKTEISSANVGIDDICTKKTSELLSKLENVALKY